MFSVANKMNGFIKDFTALFVLTGILSLVKLVSSISKLSEFKQEGNGVRY